MLQAYQELANILLNYHIGRIVLGSMCVGVSVWLVWSGCVAGLSGACDYSVELTLWSYCSWSMCIGVSMWLGLSGIRVAGFSLQHGYHSNPTAPKLQHTSNQEQYDQSGNSTAQLQAPDDGYINVRNMLST